MKKILAFILLSAFLVSCHSTKNFNEKVTKTHTVDDLKEDVDYLFDNLKKNFPRLYDYISEQELDTKIHSFKDRLYPMTSAEFYHELSPLISEIRQGHLLIRPPFKIREKPDLKRYRNARAEFNDLDFINIENEVYIEDTFGKMDSLLVKSRVLAIDSISTENLLRSWSKKITSDGFNQTFQPQFIADNLLTFYRYDVGRTDSIKLHLQKGDSVFTKKLRIVFKDEETDKAKNDTISTKEPDTIAAKIKLSRTEKRKQRKIKREKRRDRLMRGYNYRKKQDTRAFSVIGNDSSVAYLRIRSFSGHDRWSKKFYEKTFKQIDSLKIKNLILDLRGNTGGSLSETRNLYSYLAKDSFRFIKPMQTKKSLVLTSSLWSGKPTFAGYILSALATPFTFSIDVVKSKKNNDTLYYKQKYSKEQPPKPKAFNGDIYVLINGASFSASSVLSANLHGSQRAVFIGQETGGAYNGTVAGQKMIKYLPNTQISVPIWMIYIETAFKTVPDGHGIKPDIKIKPSLDDFLNDKDTVLEKALSKIESHTKLSSCRGIERQKKPMQ